MSDIQSAKDFLKIISDTAAKVFKAKCDETQFVYACLANVISVSESDEVTVRLLSGPDDGSQDFLSRNMTGEALVEGDSVWLHYWGNYTNTYIAIRNWTS